MIVEYVLSYEVDSPGEVEDIEQRLRATSPLTMDAVEPDPEPGAWATEFLTLLAGTAPDGTPVINQDLAA